MQKYSFYGAKGIVFLFPFYDTKGIVFLFPFYGAKGIVFFCILYVFAFACFFFAFYGLMLTLRPLRATFTPSVRFSAASTSSMVSLLHSDMYKCRAASSRDAMLMLTS